MRLHARLTLALVAGHLLLTAAVAALAWWAVEQALRAQAEASARAVGRVLARGGFSADERVLARMRELSGYDFRVGEAAAGPGTVLVVEDGVAIAVDYRSARFREARRALLAVALGIAAAGSAAFALIAWLVARRFARPVEALAALARELDRDLARPVPRLGSGEVAALAAELEALRGRLQAAIAAQRRAERLATLGMFAATIAHEVRNPLTAVALTVQQWQRERPHDAALARIAAELARLDLVVDEILSFARGAGGRPVVCDLRAAADDIVALLGAQAAHAGAALTAAGAGRARADPRRLRQLLHNLVRNALAACAEGRGSTVTVRVADGALVVEDDGPGVPEHLLPHLFEPYAGEGGGTGLGLYLARCIAEAHGGQLRYERADGRTRFVCTLPPAEGGDDQA